MIETVCICGAGTMGSGITEVCASAGMYTLQFDVNAEMLVKSSEAIEKSLQRQVDKSRISIETKQEIFSRIRFISDLNDCIADVIIEAIVENEKMKVGLFNRLAEINHSETIFATNTSSISISNIAAKVVHPSRMVGMHFFNPAPVMRLVEIVQGRETKNEVAQTIFDFAIQLGKTPVMCKDVPGFIVNRVARPYYLEALRLVEAGIADIETVDTIMESSGFKMGPFKLMDLIGMDINYSVSGLVWEALGKPPRLKPSSLQKQKNDAGELGKKTGIGFYKY